MKWRSGLKKVVRSRMEEDGSLKSTFPLLNICYISIHDKMEMKKLLETAVVQWLSTTFSPLRMIGWMNPFSFKVQYFLADGVGGGCSIRAVALAKVSGLDSHVPYNFSVDKWSYHHQFNKLSSLSRGSCAELMLPDSFPRGRTFKDLTAKALFCCV